MNPNLQNNSSNNFSGGNVNGYGNTITNNVDQSRRTKITIGSIAVVVVLLLVGFGIFKATGGGGSSLEKQVVGTWEGNDAFYMDRYHYAGEIIFNSDHTYVYKNHDDIIGEGVWEINSSKNLIINGRSLVWNEDQSFSTMDGQSWYLSGDVMYMEGIRYDRQ